MGKSKIMRKNTLLSVAIMCSSLALAGCASTDTNPQADVDTTQLQTAQAENASLSDRIRQLTGSLSRKDAELASTKTALTRTEAELMRSTKLPSGSSAGDCFGLAGDGKSLLKTVCPAALSPTMVKSIQSALATAGFNPGPIDGVIGPKTMAAVNLFQKARSLMQGPLSLETVRSLGVM